MSRKTLSNKEKQYQAKDIAVGIMICLVMMVMSIAIFAAMIQSNIIAEHTIGYCIVIIHLVSIMAGVSTILKAKQEHKLYSSLLCGFVYCGILIGLTALVFDGRYCGITATLSVILSGCVVPVILSNRRKNVRKIGGARKRRC